MNRSSIWLYRAILYPGIIGAIICSTLFPEPKLAAVFGVAVGYAACKLETRSKKPV